MTLAMTRFENLRRYIKSVASNLSEPILALRGPAELEANPNAFRDAGAGCYREP